MKFSIIIPVYNVEKYLGQCLKHIKNQIFQDYEVILIDDGSTDSSGSICDDASRSDIRIKVIHKKNEGLISARRVGLANASGEYCLFCDSDDFFEDDILKKIYIIQEEQKQPDVIIFNAYLYDEKGRRNSLSNSIFKDGLVEKNCVLDFMFSGYALNSLCMKAVKRSIIDLDKNYSRFYKYNLGEDLLQSVPIIIRANSIYYTGEKLYNYRISSGMMRKYNSSYYWSYKVVNEEIKKNLQKAGVEDIVPKVAVHLLKSAYGAVIQMQFADVVPKNDLRRICKDESFLEAYKIVMHTKYKSWFCKKEKIILRMFKAHLWEIIFIILKVRNYLKYDRFCD